MENGGGENAHKTRILYKVGEVSSAIDAAKQVDEVICALYSLAVLLFPLDAAALSDVDPSCRSKVCEIDLPIDAEMSNWKQAFYSGAAFPTMARKLLYDVAKDWLPCFSPSIRKQIYDSFFVHGPPSEILQVLVSALTHGSEDTIYSNIERLLVKCLLTREGVRHMVEEFRMQCQVGGNGYACKPDMLAVISRVAQQLSSIPDKARLGALSVLSSHSFFQKVVNQLLVGAEDCDYQVSNYINASDANDLDGSLLFVGETFSRICRRGSTVNPNTHPNTKGFPIPIHMQASLSINVSSTADILVAKMIPRVLDYTRGWLSSNIGSIGDGMIKPSSHSHFWLLIVEAMKDQYAIERLAEELLRQLATQNASDVEAYWILWLLFHQTISQKATLSEQHTSISFPLVSSSVVLELAASVIYITAAVGLCIEKMSKDELETTKNVLHAILQGVSCRLESPINLVRKMARAVALVFSRVVDPKNPVYLDDDYSENIDWDFGFTSQRKDVMDNGETSQSEATGSLPNERESVTHGQRLKDTKHYADNDGKIILAKRVNPSKVSNPAMPSNVLISAEEEGDCSKNSDASSDSLEPYDLPDDNDADTNKFSQLGDISAALRKPDDPDGVERALNIVEKLVRALPDELPHHSGDLIRALVHVRCSCIAVEGEEDSAEEKRHKALVALIVTCPFESLDVLTKLLYAPNVDVSQRILILDVMTDAAQELSESIITRTNYHPSNLISSVSGQPWFIPSSRGSPGVGPWREVSDPGTSVSWSHRYEREIPSRPGHMKSGKSRKWGLTKPKETQLESSRNRLTRYAAAFMLPVMQGFDKRSHGVDLLNRDFIVLGKLIYMLGVCMKCISMHPEALVLAPLLLDMIRTRALSHHAEAYVRRSVLFAASCILVALHPSHIASTMIEGNQEISNGLEWIRAWAVRISESDPDAECSRMAMTCLQLHAEMALQASRALESVESPQARRTLPTKLDKIIIPFSNLG
ncbi:hypothetical protein ZIOFF_062081 [Zingiber officinale]|uniref:Telomere length regulation protein conserved domain-containing protein n=1 Tax=Zingiber officinale TaxID=94328 RepID=A0A8J5F099_ZINOF|nr:hypothetical protein ZIOFF_062081 [Zingiber officinale]